MKRILIICGIIFAFSCMMQLTMANQLELIEPSEDIESRDYEKELAAYRSNKPLLSLNQPLPPAVIANLSNTVYLAQALSFIFTGSYGGGSGVNITEDSEEAQNTLDGLLSLGADYLITNIYAAQDNFDEFNDTAFNILGNKLTSIVKTLAENGSTAVLVKDLLPFLPYLTVKNLAGAVLLTFGPSWKKNLMTYINDEYLGGINGTCKQHTLAFFRDIGLRELWAFEMFDSQAKIPAGIFAANINWLGNYKGCTELSVAKYQLKGQYCRANIGFPILQFAGDLPIDDSIALNYGVCVSQACSEDQVASIVSNTLKLLTVFKTAFVKDVKCDDSQTFEVSTASRFWMVALGLIVGFVVLATIIDCVYLVMNQEPEVETSEIIKHKSEIAGNNVIKPAKKARKPPVIEFMSNCSLYSNSLKFFRTDNGGKITCLNGIRFFSMCWIIWGHTYNYISDRTFFFLMDNVRDIIELNNEFYAQIIINGLYGVDTFFLMSAFLLTYGLMKKFKKNGGLTTFEWAYYYIHRYWRLMPPFVIILIFYTWILPYWGNGPLWMARDMPIKNSDCHNYWWAYALFMNNFVPNGEGTACMGYLWYIPNDYQFYAISPLFIYVLWKFPKMGKALLSITILSSLLILAFLTANVYVSRKRDIIQTLLDIWSDVYIKPYCRAAPWIVGIGLGYFFFKNDEKVATFKMSKWISGGGWLMCFVLLGTAIFGGYTNHAKDGRRMEPAEYAFFFSITRLTWPLAISWIIFACHYGYGGVINNILSYPVYIPFNRLSYCAYLVHPPIMVAYYFYQKALFHATSITLIYVFFGHLISTFIVAFFFTNFFELPFVALEKLVYNPRHGS